MSTVVFDFGTSNVRVGLAANDAAPKLQIPCAVGYPKQRAHVGLSQSGAAESYVGVDLAKYRAVCDVVHPYQDNKIERQPEMLSVLQQCFELLREVPEDVRVVVTEPVGATKSFRHEVGSLFLRDLRAQAVLFACQSTCGVFGAGRTSGMFVDSGDAGTRCVAVVDGISVGQTFAFTPVAGACVTAQLRAQLNENDTLYAVEHAQQLKESLCFVRGEGDDDVLLGPSDFILPDGQSVTMSKERVEPPELLFSGAAHHPAVPFAKAPRVQDVVRESMIACDETVREDVVSAVVLGGGTPMMNGFDVRLEELMLRDYELPPATRSSVALRHSTVAPINRSWVGAAVFASLSSVDGLFVTQVQVAEDGLSALDRHRLAVD